MGYKDTMLIDLGTTGEGAIFKDIAEAQAKATWDAAIREVVDWVENNNHYSDRYDTISIDNREWEAKLKEWGFDKE